jgi:hypothetical protein
VKIHFYFPCLKEIDLFPEELSVKKNLKEGQRPNVSQETRESEEWDRDGKFFLFQNLQFLLSNSKYQLKMIIKCKILHSKLYFVY